jgi:hypothetical protein
VQPAKPGAYGTYNRVAGHGSVLCVSKIDRAPITDRATLRVMASKLSRRLSKEEFASLLTVGNTCAVLEPPAVIPAAHSVRLIALGYMADLSGRLRMTTPGRARIAAGFENRSLPPLER